MSQPSNEPKKSSAGTQPPGPAGVKFTDLLADQKFICKEMIWDSPPFPATIDRVVAGVEVPKPGSSQKDKKCVVYFRGFEKPMVLNRKNTKFLIRAFGGNNTAAWSGKEVTVYVDKSVKMGADKCGGIRLGFEGKWSGVNPKAPPSQSEGDE